MCIKRDKTDNTGRKEKLVSRQHILQKTIAHILKPKLITFYNKIITKFIYKVL